MTTATFELKVQRTRFAHHALAALTAMIPEGFKRPAAVAPSSAAREAAAVRELANSYLKTDPGFAGDLYAAANRHEMQAGH